MNLLEEYTTQLSDQSNQCLEEEFGVCRTTFASELYLTKSKKSSNENKAYDKTQMYLKKSHKLVFRSTSIEIHPVGVYRQIYSDFHPES